MKVNALIDSGADSTVVPKDMADMLGLVESGPEIMTGGIGGSAKVRKSMLLMVLMSHRERHTLQIPVLVLQDPNVDVPMIVGRNGFFEHFEITFKQARGRIVLKKVSPAM